MVFINVLFKTVLLCMHNVPQESWSVLVYQTSAVETLDVNMCSLIVFVDSTSISKYHS